MKKSTLLVLTTAIILSGCALPALSAPAAMGGMSGTQKGNTGGGPSIWNRQGYAGSLKPVQGQAPSDEGGAAETQDQEQPLEDTDLAKASGGKSAIGDAQTSLPGSGIKMKWPKGVSEAMKRNMANTDGRFPTNSETQLYLANFASTLASGMNAPDKQMHAAKANLDAQSMEVANAMADLEKQQAASAIDFCSSFLTNFTAEQGNKWNKLRDNVFVPMAILLLLPGAVLTQVKSIVSAGFPVLGDTNPFEGIQRAIVAIFLIPGTYLVLNYAIDLNNSITYSIAQEYNRLFSSDMYKDAISFHIRAFPSRQPGENRNALDQQTAQMTPLLGGKTAFALFEGKMLENKIEDPIAKIYQAPKDRADEALPSSAIAAKTMFNSSNATFMIAWNILCAFQMVYFYYLWFVGPITAALWAWPMRQLRSAFPSWVEGVITLGFWSLFWNTSILLMACFRGVDETGTLILTALNFLATSSVKYAFDFAGLAKAAGQEAASMAEKAMKSAQAGGGGGGGKGGHGGGGSHSRKGASHSSSSHAARAHHAAGAGAGLAAAGGGGGGSQDSMHQGSSHLAAASSHQSQSNSSLIHNASLSDGDSASLGLASFSAKPDTPLKSFDAGDVAPPPTADNTHNAVISHQPGQDTFTLGDYTLKRGLGEDNLLDADGNVVASINPADLADGQNHKVDFAGGSLSYQRSANTELFTLADGKHTEQVAFQHANPNAEMHPVINNGHNQVALPMANGDSLFLSQDGNSLSYTNSDGDITNIDLSSNGSVQLADGSTVSVSALDNGADISIANSNNQLTDSFSLIHNDNGSISVGHADAHDNPLGMINYSASNGTMTASSYDESGRFYQRDSLSDNAVRTEYFDPRNAQHMLGASETHYGNGGDHTTNFFNSDNALIASSQFQHLANGGTMELMRDASNNVVSSQQTVPYGDGYAMQSCNYTDGSLTNSSLSFYDQDGNVVSDVDQSYLASYAMSSLADYGVNQSTVVDNDYNSNTAAPVYGNYAAPAGTDPVHIARESVGAGQLNAMNDLLKGSVVADSRGVHPDGGIFSQAVAHGEATHASVHHAPQQAEANSSYSSPQVLESRSVQALPVDIAGTQMPGAQQALQTEFSQVQGAYAQGGEAQQGYTAHVAYSSPVVSSSVDVVPPAVTYDPTPIADQFFTIDDVTKSTASLEQVCASNVGDLVAAPKESAQAVYGAQAAPAAHELHPVPPQAGAVGSQAEVVHNPAHQEVQTAAYAHSANTVYASPATTTNVLPVDIAGTQLNSAQSLQTEFSQVQGAYAQSGDAQQGYTSHVAYSSPVVSSSVDVVPPAVAYDPTPIADQYFTTDDVTKSSASLEQVCSSNVGDLVAAPKESAQAVYGAQAVPASNEVHPVPPQAVEQTVVQQGEAQQHHHARAEAVVSAYVQPASNVYEAPSTTTNVLPVDIAGTQLNSAQSLQTEFSQVQGAYAQSGDAQQGYTAQVAYSSPVVSSSVDVVPPAIIYEPTPIADQKFLDDSVSTSNSNSSLEQVCASNVGNLVAAPAESGQAVYGAPATDCTQEIYAVPPQSADQAAAGQHALSQDGSVSTQYASASVSDAQSAAAVHYASSVLEASGTSTTNVLPVDIAGTQLNTAQSLQTEFSQVQGAYAQLGEAQQGYTSHVAYSSPVVSSSVDVVPPAITYDPSSIADQSVVTSFDTAASATLEQVCASSVGDLVAAPGEAAHAVYGAPAVADAQLVQSAPPQSSEHSVEARPAAASDVQFASYHVNAAAQDVQSSYSTTNLESAQASTNVLPVDIAGTQLNSAHASQTEFSQVQGAYAQSGDAQQGYTSHVAYSSPVVSSSVEVVPPAVSYEATPIADQNFHADSVMNNNNAPLEQVCANNAGDLVTAPNEAAQAVYAAASAPAQEECQNLPPAERVADQTLAQSAQIDATRHESQSLQIDAAQSQAQYAPYCSSILGVAAAAQEASPQSEAMAPKRGLSALFQEIDGARLTGEAEKTAGKPTLVNPAAQANPKLPYNSYAKEKVQGRELMNKMAASLAKPSVPSNAAPATTGQYLEQQVLDARRSRSGAPNSALNAALGRAGSMSPEARRSEESLNNALADYQVICSLLREGKVSEATLIANLALSNLANCNENDPQYLPLVRAYIELFQSRNMTAQVDALTARAGNSLDALAPGQTASNVWGS